MPIQADCRKWILRSLLLLPLLIAGAHTARAQSTYSAIQGWSPTIRAAFCLV
jgi:hypothetical protein